MAVAIAHLHLVGVITKIAQPVKVVGVEEGQAGEIRMFVIGQR